MTGRHQHFYSHILGRDTHAVVYGHGGKPVMVLPSQDGSGQDFEGFGMLPSCEPFLSQGQITLYCVDAIDRETWSNYSAPPRDRMALHERWIAFLTREFLPFMKADTGWQGRAMATGCSMGAYHAVNFTLKRADLFPVAIGLSGNYDPTDWRGWGETGESTYLNNPVAYVAGAEGAHLEWRRQAVQILLVVGEGPFEVHPTKSLPGARQLAAVLADKGVPHQLDVWGHDSAHDWPWWRKQIAYHLPRFC